MEGHVRLALTACMVCVAVLSASPAQGASLEPVRELAQQARYPEARMAFDGLPAEMRDGFGARLLDGVLRVRMGLLDEAIEVFADIVRTHPDRPEPRINLALLDAARWGILDVRERLVDAATEDRGRATAWWLLRDLYSRLALHAYLHADTIARGDSAEEVPPGPPALALAPLRMPFETPLPDGAAAPPAGATHSAPDAPGPDAGGQALPPGETGAPEPDVAGAQVLGPVAPAGETPAADQPETAGAVPDSAALDTADPLPARDASQETPERALAFGGTEASDPDPAEVTVFEPDALAGKTPAPDPAQAAGAVPGLPEFGTGGAPSARDAARANEAALRATGAYLEAVGDGLTTVSAGGGQSPGTSPETETASVASGSHASSWNALLKAFAVAAGTMIVLSVIGGIVLYLRGRPPRDRVFRRRLQRTAALLGGPAATVEKVSEESIFRPTEKRSRLSGLWDRIEARYPLLRIGQALPVATGAGVAGAGGCWFSLWFLQVPAAWWTMPATVLAGAGAMWYAISWLQSRQEAEFTRQFPELVDQIVRLAGAGVPPLEAVAAVAEDARDPIGPVLGSVRDGLLAGLDADTTLRVAAERVRLGEFTLFAAVIRLQRRAGGGVSVAFSNLAETLRERRATALKAHASTAQSRLTLLVLVLMPVVVLIAQKFIAPQSLDLLFGTEQGITLLRWGVGLIVTGILIARSIAARAIR